MISVTSFYCKWVSAFTTDGQIQIMISFKSWLNHVFIGFEYKGFDLEPRDLISVDVIY